eukprot:CAMPEP_0184985432 /NCGR_PEP_ID=MMETSP1098-20130426/14107_1 /TAXON_ID=89044 /ORGANISM="Spumella elongata, Strain CCAP 955/1" /LENGTH=988 /DNA_ID=CAMNT_0027509517 /DNA_START=56 /DNA_END=3022 /DNA_ORIENTATION=+
MPTHKKGHDKDKYYHLAKDQGYRSRAAFKLIQINKRFDFLSKARVCIDLCAAPGGWCQVAAKYMPTGSLVIGADLLPIRAIRNVKTMVADITTAECRRMIVQELNGWKADVVLCDGAPNIGSAYSKDAFIQNELVLAALKTATDHLVLGGTFCTKVYRSVDYNSVMWVLQQLFEDVQTMKPNSSRSQSSEIFVICLKYTKPNFIDPKLLDPNHVFKEVADPGLKKVNVLHKKYEQSNKRQRSGYDESLGMILHSKKTIKDFFETKEPIQMLTDVHAIVFTDSELCQFVKNHHRTTEEIVTCLSDLRLLGKLDFKKILKWRTQIRKEMDREKNGETQEDNEEDEKEHRAVDPSLLSEDAIQEEIANLRDMANQVDRKEKKKARRLTAKERQRQFLGMSGEGFDVGEDMELFAIHDSTTTAQLENMGDVQLEDIENFPKAGNGFDDEEEETEARPVTIKGKARRGAIIEIVDDDLEDELELAYKRFQAGRSAKMAHEGKAKKSHYNADGAEVDSDNDNVTHSEKRARARMNPDAMLARLQDEDEAIRLTTSGSSKKQRKNAIGSEDLEAYVDMLTKSAKKTSTRHGEEAENSDSSDEDSSDDEFFDKPPAKTTSMDVDSEDEEEEEEYLGTGYVNAKPGQVVTRDGLSTAGKAAKWFANPIFSSSLVTAEDAENDGEEKKNKNGRPAKKRTAAQAVEGEEKYGYSEALDSMPKTDKQARKEQRKKDVERRDRRANKSSKALLEDDDVVTSGGSDLIKRGVGKNGIVTASGVGSGFEIVPAEVETTVLDDEMARVDARKYDSDEEDYDLHDKTRTLALGTMMLRHSKKKALVDASYNRFAWNDPKNLPSWFADDEMRHNKPQLPIPNALLEQIKSRFQKTGTKEIKKVAEARMRKRKRAQLKLKAAKKQANVMAESNEVSERQKLKAISKAMKANKIDKPGKVYVVTRKTSTGSTGTSSGAKGKMKFVDKRLRCDTRALKRKEKRGPKRKK